MHYALKHLGFFFLILLAAGLGSMKPEGARARFLVRGPVSEQVQTPDTALYSEDFLPDYNGAPEVHAASLVETSSGDVLAAWYAGSYEGAKDVAIYGAVLKRASGRWEPLGMIVNRQQTSRDLGRYIKKLGNPVLARDAKGRIWLFYVSVSVGGWSGSSLNYCISLDDGHDWSPARRLVTSPFLNISTLVKGAPVLLADGSIGLPVYHEFAGKFGEFLRVSPEGQVLDKSRITWGRSSLQPVVLPVDPERAAVFLRYAGGPPARILASRTVNGGRSWEAAEKLDLPNPNAAIAAVRTWDSQVIMVYNDLEKDRHNLSLAVSEDDGVTWQKVHTLEDDPVPPPGKRRGEFSYPYLIQSDAGMFHLAYTWQKSRIKHVSFNRAWLDGATNRAHRNPDSRTRDTEGDRRG